MTIRDLLAAHIATLRTPAQRRALAAELRALADEQERLADAERRELTKPAAKRLAPKHGAGGRPSTPFITIRIRDRKDATANEIQIRFSQALYTLMRRPPRIDVQSIGGKLVCVPVVRGDAGYSVTVNIGGIFINASGARDLIHLGAGKYHVAVDARGVVTVGEVVV